MGNGSTFYAFKSNILQLENVSKTELDFLCKTISFVLLACYLRKALAVDGRRGSLVYSSK